MVIRLVHNRSWRAALFYILFAPMLVAGIRTTLETAGTDEYGQLGSGRVLVQKTPYATGIKAKQALKSLTNTVVLLENGDLMAMGFPGAVTFKTDVGSFASTLTLVAQDVVSFDLTFQRLYYITKDGTLWGAGWGSVWNFGVNGPSPAALLPAPVQIATDVKQVSATNHMTLFVKKDGTLWYLGSAGVGPFKMETREPVQMATGVVKAIGLSWNSVAFLTENRELFVLGGFVEAPWYQNVYYTVPKLLDSKVADFETGNLQIAWTKGDGSLWFVGSAGYDDWSSSINEGAPTLLATNLKKLVPKGRNADYITVDGDLMRLRPAWRAAELELVAKGVKEAAASADLEYGSADVSYTLLDPAGYLSTMGSNVYGLANWQDPYLRTSPLAQKREAKEILALFDASCFVDREGKLWVAGQDTAVDPYQRDQPANWRLVASNVKRVGRCFGEIHYVTNDGYLYRYYYDYDKGLAQQIQAVDTEVEDIFNDRFGALVYTKKGGVLWVRGANYEGRLGAGATEYLATPITLVSDVASVAMGDYHALALTADGTVLGTGRNTSSQLGIAGTPHLSFDPITDQGAAVAAGTSHSLILKKDGVLYAMGSNALGQLGAGSVEFYMTPTEVLRDVVKIAAAFNHSFAIKRDGSLWATGQNLNGQLGDGTTVAKKVWTKVAERVDAVSTSLYHTIRLLRRDSSLYNLSTRAMVGTGGDVLIAGFTVEGSAPRKVLVRAAGPGLKDLGLNGTLVDPQLEVYAGSDRTPFASNDDWGQDALGETALAALFKQTGAFGWKPGSKDAATVLTLNPGSYTALVRGKADGTGVAIVEIYDLETKTTSAVSNLSGRSLVQPGVNVQIAGFVVTGNDPKAVLIRAAGPALNEFGVPRTLANPQIEVFRADGTLVAKNLDWSDTDQAKIAEAAKKFGAFPWQPGSKDAAFLTILEPGGYTAVVRGTGDESGVALVEVYDAD